jgi:predicted Zn-dependent protease
MLKNMNQVRNCVIAAFLVTLTLAGCSKDHRLSNPTQADTRIDLPGGQSRKNGSVVAYEHYTRAELLELKGDFKGAVSGYRSAVTADPSDAYLRTRLAVALINIGQPNSARRHIDHVLSQDPANEYAWFAMAAFYHSKGINDKAEAAAMRAIRVEPELSETAIWLAELYLSRGEPLRAAELLRRVDEGEPLSAQANFLLGEVNAMLGNYREAQRQFTAFLEKRTDQAAKVVERARTTLLNADPQAAADLIELAISKDPTNADLRTTLIELLLDLGLRKRATLHVRSLPPLEPDNATKYIERSCLLARAGHAYEGRSLLVSYFGPEFENPPSRLTLAAIEILLERLETAKTLLDVPTESWSVKQINHKDYLLEQLELVRKKRREFRCIPQ